MKRQKLKFMIYVAFALFVIQIVLMRNNKRKEIIDDKISYEDEKFREYEARRRGPGEHGERFSLTDPKEIEENQNWFAKEGFYVIVSDKISVDRALPDQRPLPCRDKKYLKDLPKVSVIICFHNEILSVLKRCIHSVINRSPPQLLHEIILVNDASTYENLGDELENYVKKDFFEGKIKFHKNSKREGLIRARMIGARLAEAEVIIFLDSHMEVNIGWLPPLLDVIAHHPTWAAVPQVDGLSHEDFSPDSFHYGEKGHFDWELQFAWYNPQPGEHPELGENFDIAAMPGGAYAINREHFFFLEGYDEQLEIWNGENYELGFKLWLCPGDKPPGGMQRVPCSRVNHLSKATFNHGQSEFGSTFIDRNLKRVVEVWFDDYKKIFYEVDEEKYSKINPGDLTKQFEFKKRMNCKPFQYYLDNVATRLLEFYPLTPRYKYAGNLQLEGANLCFSLNQMNFHKAAILTPCSDDPTKPFKSSNFCITAEDELKINTYQSKCLDAIDLTFYYCHKNGGNQAWIYDSKSHQIKVSNAPKCLTGHDKDQALTLEPCSDENVLQKWLWGIKNVTEIL